MTCLISTLLVLFKVTAADCVEPLWLRYPAISPDGSVILFCYGGDIYRVDSAGGTAIPLTLSEGHDTRPVWSHDGRLIAFASDRYGSFDVFVMPADGGTATRITFHSAADFPSDFTSSDDGVIFSSARLDTRSSIAFPSGAMSELYEVSVNGGRPRMLLTTPALDARWDSAGERLLYHDCKGYEDDWRKHHLSSIARDIWLHTPATGEHSRVTAFAGEDRNPVWISGGTAFHYLSEEGGATADWGGNSNVWRYDLQTGAREQLTFLQQHPVRFLSSSVSGDLCFSYNGILYRLPAGTTEPQRLQVEIRNDVRNTTQEYIQLNQGITEMALSPNGRELAFVLRGEIFVTATDYAATRRITDTPEQERSVSFSPDGRELLYAAEREDSWNIYRSRLTREEEQYFHSGSTWREEPLLTPVTDVFQPAFSPDGKEVAFLEERTILRVLNLASGQIRTVLPGEWNYSYADGDQWYEWSPAGDWFLVQYIDRNRWSGEVGLVPTAGDADPINLTLSGYEDFHPRWMMDGKMMIWLSDRYGMRSHGSWGSQDDVFALFFTRQAWDEFQLDPAEFELVKEQRGDEEQDEEEDDDGGDKKRKKKRDKKPHSFTPPELPDPLLPELEGIEDRRARLTRHSSRLADAVLEPKGEKLYYLARFEKGYDLWEYEHRAGEIRLLTKLAAKRAGSLTWDREKERLFLLADGAMLQINPESGEQKKVEYSAEMRLQAAAEREYIFDHAWRQMLKKFYVEDMHGVDWVFYRDNYRQFLPHINNNYDLAELLSELLGELNASHTGSGFRAHDPGGTATASLGIFIDPAWSANGLRIAEIIEQGPLQKADTHITDGTVIEQIEGQPILAGENWYPLLDRRAGVLTELALYDPASGDHWQEIVKPISGGEERELLYQRWIETRRLRAAEISDGRIGYVHVRNMSDNSFRETFAEILGRHSGMEALVVDTRFNGGGNLTDDLATFLSGKIYARNVPRGQLIGGEPWAKWHRPSIVVMCEGNYSDAHYFPWAYRELGIGQLVGMPVPGTATSVWWETQQDRTLYFGIPEVGIIDNRDHYLENQQLEPDYLVNNDPSALAEGRDLQLEKAVEVLLQQLAAEGTD
ncbi:MAG: PD40 domain-containing protein [Candidatus Delongbacteria bacterium]|nr:PD40 domain-containing protein [Candidatus Delongbacteria bacterium]